MGPVSHGGRPLRPENNPNNDFSFDAVSKFVFAVSDTDFGAREAPQAISGFDALSPTQ